MKNFEKAIKEIMNELNYTLSTAVNLMLGSFLNSELVDSKLHDADMFDEFYKDLKPEQLAIKVAGGDFSWVYDYFYENENGNIITIEEHHLNDYLEGEFNKLSIEDANKITNDFIEAMKDYREK